MKSLTLRMESVGPWPMNSYALIDPDTTDSVLIDPGADPDRLSEMLAGTRPVAILLTHSHPDHVGSLKEMLSRLAIPLYAHAGPHFQNLDLPIDHQVTTGNLIQVGRYALKVYVTPGHIEDQVCYYLEGDKRAIVGDTIFEGGPGKTWSSAGFQTTLETLRKVVLKWPDETICYPGHGPHFRLGDQRTAIQAFLHKDHGEFYGDATWAM